MKIRIAMIVAISLATLGIYQNCGQDPLGDSAMKSSNYKGYQGNGDSYEGKPVKEYYSFDSENICGHGPDYPKSIVSIDDLGQAVLLRKSCLDVQPFILDPLSYEISPDAPEILTAADQMFEEKEYAAATPLKGVWTCRTQLDANKAWQKARLTLAVRRDADSNYKVMFSYAVYNSKGDLLSVRRSLNKAALRSRNNGRVIYVDDGWRRGTVRLAIDPGSKTANLSMEFSQDPDWTTNTEPNETKDRDVLQPLGQFSARDIKCWGGEK